MSRQCSNNLVADIVDHAITITQKSMPNGLIKSTKIEVAAKNTKGSRE